MLVLLFVFGGVGIVMFGMVVVNGIKVLLKVDFVNNLYNLFIVVVSVGMGFVLVVLLYFFLKLLFVFVLILYSGILLVLVLVVILNIVFNGVKGEKDVCCEIWCVGYDFDGWFVDVYY